MSLNRVLETLAAFGLKPSDARVYVFLAKEGPRIGKELSSALNMPKWRLYTCLRNLRDKAIVGTTPEYPHLFYAVPFEKAIDLLLEAKIEETRCNQENTKRAISDWESMMKEDLTK